MGVQHVNLCLKVDPTYHLRLQAEPKHPRNFLDDWCGKLVCDDIAGYKAVFELDVIEIGCMAHARRKFFHLHVTNKRVF